MSNKNYLGNKRFHSLELNEPLKRNESFAHRSITRQSSQNNTKIQNSPLPSIKKSTAKRNFFKETPEIGQIERYQKYLMEKQSEEKYKNIREFKQKKRLHTEGIRLEQQVALLSSQIKEIRKQLNAEHSTQVTLKSRIIGELADHFRERNFFRQDNPPPPPMPVYIPFPMPIPYSQQKFPKPFARSTKKMSTQLRRKTSSKPSFERSRTRPRMLWRKLSNCLLFIIYLKRFCRIARTSRKALFSKFYSKLPQKLGIVREIIGRGLKQFVSSIKKGAQISLNIQQDDSPQQSKEKMKAMRKLINMMLNGISQQFKTHLNKESNTDVIESLYFLCKHGNYSCSQPLLTKQQLELTCISEAFRYVSADFNLEQLALTNLVMVKLLLFNTLFSNNMKNQIKSAHAENNIYLVGSVVYQILLDFQNELAQEVPSLYKIGNYLQQDSKVRGLQSMVVGQAQVEKGQLISGLGDVEQMLKSKNWRQQKKIIRQLIELFSHYLKKFHKKFIAKFY